jgi:hypothetical protein
MQELGRELRFEATGRVFDLSFTSRNLAQHGVQLSWTRYE